MTNSGAALQAVTHAIQAPASGQTQRRLDYDSQQGKPRPDGMQCLPYFRAATSNITAMLPIDATSF